MKPKQAEWTVTTQAMSYTKMRGKMKIKICQCLFCMNNDEAHWQAKSRGWRPKAGRSWSRLELLEEGNTSLGGARASATQCWVFCFSWTQLLMVHSIKHCLILLHLQHLGKIGGIFLLFSFSYYSSISCCYTYPQEGRENKIKNSKQSYLTSISDLRCCSCSCRWRERSRYSPRSFSISRLSWSTSVSLSRSREVRSWGREYEGPKASVLPPRVRSGRSPVEPMAMWWLLTANLKVSKMNVKGAKGKA